MDVETILELIRSHGDAVYAFLAAYAASNSLLLPLFAGYAAHLGAISLDTAIACIWIGGIVGDQIRFAIGRRFGLGLFDAFPRVRRGIETAALLADRHQCLMVMICRYPHMVRGFAGFAFGMSTMPLWRFSLLNVLSATVWAPLVVGCGYAFGAFSQQALGDAAGRLSLALFTAFSALFWLLSRRLDRALPVVSDQGKRDSAYSQSDR
ncbi:MAG: DedA family protein [Alphaproteobacteria bacterium]|nr:DedA family protein [Alphaproteobacteria bacterium]